MSTESAQVTPTATGATVAIGSSERLGVRSAAAVRAERRAWLILWLAFATLCVLVFAAGKYVVEYVSTAQVDKSAFVTSQRGHVFVVVPGSGDQSLLGDRSELGVGTAVALDRTAAASAELQLFDGTAVRLQSGSSLELTRMEVGRFINQQSVRLTQTDGAVRYATAGAVDVEVPGGVVQLGPHGDFTVWQVGDTSHVLVYGGEAHLLAGGQSVTVGEGQRGDVTGQRTAGGPWERQISLLPNGNFAQHDDGWQAHDKVNGEQDQQGSRQWVSGPVDLLGYDVTALRVHRDSVSQQHGETGLAHQLNTDVSGFRHLWLRAWVRVDNADLSGGGQLGYEYPMMLQLQIEGPGIGTRPDWVVGFYYANDEHLPVPENTAELWPQHQWQPYQIDLMDTDPSRQPYRLLNFAVMGQGHSFDARVANIELVGD